MHTHTHTHTHTGITNIHVCAYAAIKMALAVIHQTHTHTTTGLCFVNLCLNYYLISLLSLVAMCTFTCEPALQECALMHTGMHTQTHTHKQTNKHSHTHIHTHLLTPFCLVLHLHSLFTSYAISVDFFPLLPLFGFH